MKFTLDGSAGGAAAAGQGIGSALKAFAMAPMAREQAQRSAEEAIARIYASNMSGNQRAAEAAKATQEAEGLRLTNTARSAPVDAGLPQYLQHAYRIFGATGDTNMDRFASAAQALQAMGMTDKAAGSIADADAMNRWNTLAKPGQAYLPFDNVGNTGHALNKATGAAIEASPVLAKLFGDKTGSEIAENRAQASSASAAAGKYGAEAAQTRMENDFLRERGQMPGRGAEGGEGALSSTILRTLDIPVTDEKGRVVRNPISGEPEMQTDRQALSSFYGWASSKGRKPTAAAFATWEAEGRPGANKSPAPSSGAQTMTTKRGQYASADEVRTAFKAGKLSKEQARAILQGEFGMK